MKANIINATREDLLEALTRFTPTATASGATLSSFDLSKMTNSTWNEELGAVDITKESESEKLKRFFKYSKLQKEKS